MVVSHGSDRETPYGVVFNPRADGALSSADVNIGTLTAFDCSWESVSEAMFLPPGECRVPPYLAAVDPVNFGRPM